MSNDLTSKNNPAPPDAHSGEPASSLTTPEPPLDAMALSGAVLRLLRRINRASDLHSKELERMSGLTTPQLIVLRAIEDLGEVTAGRIAAHVSLSQGTVSMILDRLETHGLIARYRSLRDRRIVQARLTQAGGRALAAAPPLLRERFVRRFLALDVAEQARMVQALGAVADMMDADADPTVV